MPCNPDFHFILGDQEELEVNAERLICRCLTIDINISTPRNEVQEEALNKANEFLAKVEQTMQQNLEGMHQTVQALVNACSPEPSGNVPPNSMFQAIILGCTAEDQKKIRKRLLKMLEGLKLASPGYRH